MCTYEAHLLIDPLLLLPVRRGWTDSQAMLRFVPIRQHGLSEIYVTFEFERWGKHLPKHISASKYCTYLNGTG